MKPAENIREKEQEKVEPAPIVIRRLDRIETTGFPRSTGSSN